MPPQHDSHAKWPPSTRDDSPPVRCQMESALLSIFQEAGLVEWMPQQGEPGRRPQGESSLCSPSTSSASDGKSSRSSSRSTRASSRSRDSKMGRKSGKRKVRSSRQDRSNTDQHPKIDEEDGDMEEDAKHRAKTFVPDYSGYNTVDAELKLIGQLIRKRGL
ncbi:hypothetical protein QQS21_004751 [Conoideocrella luteorostrata]|uniref:Uncharacterized protein n=1 Tax=Conoideocrella luteorostrata TaxID=1105319 RepID=A0AAJ0CQV2_9HYPO|nr:hypothetical protein QQS21_004751 [Conoideocrella luteorostrata]